jgi:hypothetical protein
MPHTMPKKPRSLAMFCITRTNCRAERGAVGPPGTPRAMVQLSRNRLAVGVKEVEGWLEF